MATELTRREFLKCGTVAIAAFSFSILPSHSSYGAVEIDPAAIRNLQARLKGRVIVPGSVDYDSARKIWNPKYDKHPAIVARCASVIDVIRSIEFARERGLTVSVRSGRHDQGGFSTNDGGIVIDLAELKEIKVDPAGKTVTAGGGVLVGELYRAVAPSGMGVVSGGCPSVGIGGLTLGGGQSALSSKYGFACDNVLSMEVVTADGKLLSASETENADLFWALRGGSGNFGVVTKFEYRLVSVNRLIAGVVTYSIAERRTALNFFREFVASAPDELTAEILFGFPFPAGLFGIAVVYCGEMRNAERLLKPLSNFGPPVTDSIREVSFVEAVREEEPPRLPNYEKDALLSRFSDKAVDAFCEHLANPPPLYQAGLFEMHGAVCRGTSAYRFKEPTFDSYTWGFWRSKSDRARTVSWVDQLWSSIARYASGAYVNGLDEDEDQCRIRQEYGASYERLVALKNKYDPSNFFHMNQNIKST
jgi:FAD/FMN-containing dehydrogenase